MTIDQIIKQLTTEQKDHIADRFPCRAIMVRNIDSYCDLLDRLHQISEVEFVPSSTLFSGPDVMPQYKNLTASDYHNRWLVLTGVSEYLRLFGKNEAETQRLAKLWSHHVPVRSTGRIIIPLWGCEAQWHDPSLHLTDDPRRQDHYFDCMGANDAESQLKLLVLSDSFRAYKDRFVSESSRMMDGLQAWYEYWAKPEKTQTNQVLITGRFGYIQPVNGNLTVHVVSNTLSYLQENIAGGDVLTCDSCPEEAQTCLFEKALQKSSLEKSILSCLNVLACDSLDVMGKWGGLYTIGQKQLVCLWYQLHPDGSYLCHCILGAKRLEDVENRILHEIFRMNRFHPGWVDECQKLISVMKLNRDDTYFEALDQIPEYSERLAYLSGSTPKERSYLLHMVGMWMRADEAEASASATLQSIYPALGAYLDGSGYDTELRQYMKRYKCHKLANTLPEDEQMYFSGIQTDRYDFRYTALYDALDTQTIVLWVDALGVEWMPLLLWSLQQSTNGTVRSCTVGQAVLPAETEFNRQWEKMAVPHDKLDKLDKLAHKGVVDDPNYYSCVEEQIEFVTSIPQKVSELLKKYHRVIITGDHGTSRLAARFFHKRDGIPLAKGGKALDHGRYAWVPSEPSHLMETQASAKDDAGNRYIVFKNYDHFVQPGFAAGPEDDDPIFGEVHGGGTPEEMLVPIIVFDSNEPLPLTASWHPNTVKIKMRKATAILHFNQPVHTLEAKIGTNSAVTLPSQDGKEWTVVFSGLKDGHYPVSLAADGKLVPIEDLTVRPALGNMDGDLG